MASVGDLMSKRPWRGSGLLMTLHPPQSLGETVGGGERGRCVHGVFQSDDIDGRCLHPRAMATTLQSIPKILDQLVIVGVLTP